MGSELQDKVKNWVRFEPSISLGNVITLILLASSVFVWATTVERSLAVHDIRLSSADAARARLHNDMAINRQELREALREIQLELRAINSYIRQGNSK